MSPKPDPAAQAAALQAKLRQVHGISGRDLRQALARARRVLPRHLRKAGLEIAEAEALVGHPKLERMIDAPRLAAVQKDIEANLDAVDVARMRRDRRLDMAARIAAYLLIVGAAFISWMVWAGHL